MDTATAVRAANSDAAAEPTLERARDELSSAGTVLAIRAKAEEAYRILRVRDGTPTRRLDWELETTVRRCAGQDPAHQALAWMRFKRWLEDFGKRPDLSKLRFEENEAAAIAAAAGGARQLVSMGLQFNPVQFVSTLAARGVRLVADADGSIRAAPSQLLNGTDRRVLADPPAAEPSWRRWQHQRGSEHGRHQTTRRSTGDVHTVAA